MARNFSTLLLVSAVIQVFIAGCSNTSQLHDSAVGAALPGLMGAKATSNHYVEVTFAGSADDAAEVASNYTIIDPDGNPLTVHTAELSADARQVILTTDPQKEVLYTLTVPTKTATTVLVDRVPTMAIGSLGFVGSSDREPFLQSAISLSNSEILLSFSERMDKESAENIAFYRISDPDGETDLDIEITGAVLDEDETSVVLTTTPQENIEYTINVTNVKSRFTCADGELIVLDDSDLGQGDICTELLNRPLTTEDLIAPFSMTAHTQVDHTQPTNPNAVGHVGTVVTSPCGAGVMLACSGSESISGSDTTIHDEELIFTFDRPFRADRIVLMLQQIEFTTDEPVFFVSTTENGENFYTITEPEIRAAFAGYGISRGNVLFEALDSLDPTPEAPYREHIEVLKLRETNKSYCAESICLTDGRQIDPTRRTVQFWGIPPVDTISPQLVRAESISDTEVILSFSEPLNSEAADPSHFSIYPDLIVIRAEMTRYDTQIILTTTPNRVDVIYTVTVNDVRDKANNLIAPSANSATFTYAGGPASLGADALPRVVGAASQGNTSVLVVFSKPMGPSAEVAGNYVIVQENVNPEVGALGVLNAAFLSPRQDAVELTTTSQNEVTYVLTVVNVRDLSGNQLAPPQLLVDPARAVFAGTPFSCGGDPCDPPDSDGDTIPDATELRGYVVTVELCNGEIAQREVTSDMFSPDTDGDGLGDEIEKSEVSDPRNGDTDGDQLSDYVEYNFVYSSLIDQDTDDDGNTDGLEVDFFKTNALLADSDGDGFDDDVELYEMNRDPRIADLPSPGLSIGSVDLHIEESFSYTDENGRATTEESSSQSTLSSSTQTTTTSQVGFNLGIEANLGFEGGWDSGPVAKGTIGVGASLGWAFQHTSESARASMQAFETSMSKGTALTGCSSATREVTGGRIDAMVDLQNLGDVAFTLSNLEITVSTTDPVDRTQILPVATLVPSSTLVTGVSPEYNLGVLGSASRGPIMFTSRDVFPALVEDLMRDPRGLIFEFANYDLTDEFDRNFAYTSQMARDRTVGLVVDFGDDRVERYFVAYAPVRFDSSTCDPDANPGCDIVGGFAGFADANIPEYQGVGPPPGLPLEYVLEDVLLLRRSEPAITPLWLPQPEQVNELVGDDPVPPDGILVGPNGVSDSIAVGDDVQLIPFGIDGLPEDAVVISAGNDGILDSDSASDDREVVITGYATTKTCGPTTPSSIRPGPNKVVETLRDPLSDDEQLVEFDEDDQDYDTDVIGPGPNGFIDTAPAGDDVYVGPGIPCDHTDDCPGVGMCDGQEVLYRFERRARGQFGRVWAVLLPDESLLGLDFRKVVLRPGEVVNLGFIQDLDRDGLISDVEFLFGSSDTRQDTDGDRLDDFSEVRVGWEVGVEGQDIRRVFPDPRLTDTDRDGLTDREEQDYRRVQCECIDTHDYDIPPDGFGDDDGEACTRSGTPNYCVGGENDANDCTSHDDCLDGSCQPRPDTPELCRGGKCVNVADTDLPQGTACTSNPTLVRLDPRRRDTDDDGVTDAEEVLGWLTRAAVIDPQNVIVAGDRDDAAPDRRAETIACPKDTCSGGSMHGMACRFDRDCPSLKVCTKGINKGVPCVNDIECQGPTPATSGLCEEGDTDDNPATDPPDVPDGDSYKGICERTGCDDVQVIEVSAECAANGTGCVVGLDPSTVVVAPGPDGELHPDTLESISGTDKQIGACTNPLDCQVELGEPDLRASTTARGDDQQVAIVDPDTPLNPSTVLLRTIVRPGINGVLDTLQPSGDDAVAFGQFIQTTDPLKPDTDRDQISDGNERRLGSDPRDPADGGLLADRDGDGLTDQQESVIGWTITVKGVDGNVTRTVYSNPNNPDSDNDGLPDLAESILRTDPTMRDTDGDTLEDFDEVSDAQFDDLEQYNDLFLGFFLDRSFSMVYGTSPLDCDSDGDRLTDDFEVLEGFDVTVRVQDGLSVFHVFTDPANPDTDFDGLTDGQEFKNRVKCASDADCEAVGSSSTCEGEGSNKTCAELLPTDPTDFDSDDDGRKDGDECADPLALPTTRCEDLTQALVQCDTHPLVPDKRVTIRFLELILNQVDSGDGGWFFLFPPYFNRPLYGIDWLFGAQRSDESFPGTLWAPPLSTNQWDCEPVGFLFGMCGNVCLLTEGNTLIFGEDVLGGTCQADENCPDFDVPFWPWPPVEFPLEGWCDIEVGSDSGRCKGCYGDAFCFPGPLGDNQPDNEREFALRSGQGILIYGEVRVIGGCAGSKCVGGPHDSDECINADDCCGPVNCGTCNTETNTCVGGANDGANCTEATQQNDCCEEECGWCKSMADTAAMVTYFKSLSFESLTEGFTADFGTMNNSSDKFTFRTTIVVEILVE